jgi:hypothetical protein
VVLLDSLDDQMGDWPSPQEADQLPFSHEEYAERAGVGHLIQHEAPEASAMDVMTFLETNGIAP